MKLLMDAVRLTYEKKKQQHQKKEIKMKKTGFGRKVTALLCSLMLGCLIAGCGETDVQNQDKDDVNKGSYSSEGWNEDQDFLKDTQE